MADVSDTIPNTTNLCGPFTVPAVRDSGRSYSAPIRQDCAAPDVTVDGQAEIVYVDEEPQALEIE